MLSLPQNNGSRISIPNVPNYRRVLEAFGFDVVMGGPTRLTMERHFPDNNGFDGAWQFREQIPAQFAAEVQAAIQLA